MIGNSASGVDIGRQIAAVCRLPLIVSQSKISSYHTENNYSDEYPSTIALYPNERAVQFADGRREADIDAILLCTGFRYSYPFLSSLNPPIVIDGATTHGLFKHIFHVKYRTLAFVGLLEKTLPIPLAESQACVVARVFAGRLALPSPRDMAQWVEDLSIDCEGSHILPPPRDIEYMQAMYLWAQAVEPAGPLRESKFPLWGEREMWVRERIPAMRKAFIERKDRRAVRSMEELGFVYIS